MSLDMAEIKHVAALSKLGLSAAELKRYGEQLGAILSYIDQLAEVDTSQVETATRLGENFNVWADDKATPWDDDGRQIALEQTLEMKDGQVKVPRVLE
ncbi:Asp-tRNA(Asn)/Glu-tRNA(Gln) amidotransferase GatCAB subunit C [Candidatus Falkowbacteria bacterium CG_4_10_14_0_2_um_filter_41_15]|uniref:Aspartyl/glutamyl-tRNA(Asn/Gln) amidotransferase subunit C n=1 Tax=Candidatus Falkowbacteria bacterium CG_4_10_14_0_2_um_filter_41_15 TaxID=1974554 RepID=A0A2M7VXD8_9BACT|nr:MAG: Asp-tRNA(Asn)/Glu-tRNA(Gln) amidotransferase GatCAB subunit C [Candidatus Falkowbacteria bacterium CG_4_10_14_0_2_um_filter_41_15]